MVTLNSGDIFHLQAESVPEPVLAVDNQMRLVVFNTAAETFLGYQRQQVLGRHLNSLLIGGFGPISLARLQEAVATGREGQVGEAHVSARHNQGYHMSVEASLSLLHDRERGFHVVATLRNDSGSNQQEPRLRVISRINHLLMEKGPWETRFGALHDELQQLGSIQWMGLILLSPGGQRARVHNTHASYRNSRIMTGLDLDLDLWMEGALTQGRQVLLRIRPRGGHALEKHLYLDGLRQLMVLPLSLGEQITGVLVLGSMQAEGLTTIQTDIIEQLIPQLTLALGQELTQDRLAASQRHYQGLLDNLHEAVFRTDISGRLEFANSAMARMMDCKDTRSLLTGAASIPFFDTEEGREILAKLESEGRVADQPVLLQNCQGQMVTLTLSARMVLDDSGHPIAIEGTLQDLSEQERLNNALAESEARFQKVLTDSEDCILLADDDGLIIQVNQAAMDMLGLTRGQLIGQPADEILKQCRESSMKERTCREVGQTIEVFTREGERVEVWQGENLAGEPAPPTLNSPNTMTTDEEVLNRTRKEMDSYASRLEERLASHREGLANSEQLTELGHLVASVAREINDPMSAMDTKGAVGDNINDQLSNINGLIDEYEKLAGQVEQTPELEEVMEALRQMRSRVASDQAHDPQRAIQPSFDVEPKVTGSIAPDASPFAPLIPETPLTMAAMDLNQEVESCLKVMEQQLRSRATVIYEPGKLPEVACDSEQVGQVLMNLLLNALQSMDQLGTIRVSTRHDGDQAVVEIVDDGVGLSLREQERIFDAFYTTRDDANGLGLTISRRIIEAHGGQIKVNSKVGAGSTFSIHLPVPDINNGPRPPGGPDDLDPVLP